MRILTIGLDPFYLYQKKETKLRMSPALIQNDQETDSDSDVEFEDVPISLPTRSINREDIEIPITIRSDPQPQWTPTLSLPQQRSQPIPSGSEEETQLRGQISSGIERVTYRKMKSDMGMDAPDTPASERRYDSFKDLAADVEDLIDTLWASATREFHILYYIPFFIISFFSLPHSLVTCIVYILTNPSSGNPNRSPHNPSRLNTNLPSSLPL